MIRSRTRLPSTRFCSIATPIAASVLMLVLLTGCSGNDGMNTSTQTKATASAPTGGSSSTAGVDKLTKSEAIAAGDASCDKHNKLIAAVPEPASPADTEAYLRKTTEIYRGEVAELRNISVRSEDNPHLVVMVDKLDAYFDQIERSLPEIAANPAVLNSADSPYGRSLMDLTTIARDLGFKVCGQPTRKTTDTTG